IVQRPHPRAAVALPRCRTGEARRPEKACAARDRRGRLTHHSPGRTLRTLPGRRSGGKTIERRATAPEPQATRCARSHRREDLATAAAHAATACAENKGDAKYVPLQPL